MSFKEVAGIIDQWFGRACAVPITLAFDTLNLETAGLVLDLVLPKHAWHLKHFHVRATMHHPSVLALAVPFPVLRTLQITYAEWMGLPQFLQMLRDSPRLVKATLGLAFDEDQKLPTGPMVIQTSLQYLALSPGRGDLLGLLDLPALRTLALVGMSSPGTLVPAFLARSSASLSTFTYCGYSARDLDGLSLQWFHIMRNLIVVALEAIAPELTRKCLLALNRETDVDFLPCLAVLEICQDNHTVDEPVIAALGSRYPGYEAQDGRSKLRVLRLICSRPGEMVDRGDVGDVDWDALVQLSTLGMNIHVGTQSQNFLRKYDDSEGEE